MPHKLAGLKQEITTLPSGINTRSTSRKVRCGSCANSSACGNTTRSKLLLGNGRDSKSHRKLNKAPDSCAFTRPAASTFPINRLRLTTSVLDMIQSSYEASKANHLCCVLIGPYHPIQANPTGWRETQKYRLPGDRIALAPIPAGLLPGGNANQGCNSTIGATLVMELLALPAFTDNYIWMIHNGQEALVVDPGDASPVIQTLNQNGLKLKAILVTHRHADHIAGIAALQPYLDGPIYGPESLQNSASITLFTKAIRSHSGP